jgi:hypothetical protein
VLNRDVFKEDPSLYRIPNDGVAKIIFPPADGAPTQTLKDELRTFITDGEFGGGLLRILESFRGGLGQGSQKAVWIRQIASGQDALCVVDRSTIRRRIPPKHVDP